MVDGKAPTLIANMNEAMSLPLRRALSRRRESVMRVLVHGLLLPPDFEELGAGRLKNHTIEMVET